MRRRKLKLSDLRFTLFLDQDEQRKKLFHLTQRFKYLTTGRPDNADGRNQSEQLELEREMEEIYLQIGLHGMTMSELSERKSRLMEILTLLPPGSRGYQDYMADLNELKMVEIFRKSQFINIDLKWKKKSN